MTNNTNQPRRSSGSAISIGIGMLIGLIVALIVAAFAMSSGPFRDKANTNTLAPATGSTDPNSPLYTNSGQPPVLTTPNSDMTGNEQGEGTEVLMNGSSSSGAPSNPSLSQKPSDDSTTKSSADTSKSDQKADDPIGALINKSDSNKKPSMAGNDSSTKTDTSEPSKTTPKATAPSPAKSEPKPKDSGAPKTVTPVTAPSAKASGGNRYTVQAGSFADEQTALRLKKQLASQGQVATVTSKQTANGTLYRVRVGNYASAQEAQAANQKLKGVVLSANP